MALKVSLVVLWRNVDKLKSNNMSMIFGMVEIPYLLEMCLFTTKDENTVEQLTKPE